MSVDINLAQVNKTEQKRAEKVKKIKAVSVAALIVIAFLAVIIFAVDYRFSASYVKNQETELLQELEARSETSAKIFIVNSKLAEITKIIDARQNYSEKSAKLMSEKSDAIEVDEFKIDEEGIEMSITSPSLTDLDNYINFLIDLSEEKEFSTVKLEKLEFKNNEYEADIIMI